MTKIRILHCIETLESGGVEQRRLSLVKLLDREKFELRIICTQALGPLIQEFEKENIVVDQVGKLTNSFKRGVHKNVRKVIRSYNPHIIHGAVFEGVTMAAINGFLCRVPIRIIEETSDPQNRSAKATKFLKLLSLLAHKAVAISPSVQEYLMRSAGIPERKVVLINNGVYPPRVVTEEERLSLRMKLGLSQNDFLIGSGGRIRDDHKAFSDLIKAVAILKSDCPELKLMIVGEGPDREALTALSESLGVGNRVIWPGFQKEMDVYYAAMDVFGIVSNREGFGLVAVEAMFHKLPVIATSVGGLKSIVVHDETGFLVDRNQPEQIASCIMKLYERPDLRQKMGKAGLNRAQQEYSAQVYVEKVERLYRSLLESRGLL